MRLPQGVSAKREKLFVVVPPMHYVKLSPLWRGQRTQNRMIEDADALAEARFTPRDNCIHLGNL
jgi:hypothetical protein